MIYIFDCGIELTFVSINDGFEVGFVLIIFSVEIKDDFGELGDFLAHFVV